MAFYYGPIAWLTIAVTRLALSFVPAPGPRPGWVLAAVRALHRAPAGRRVARAQPLVGRLRAARRRRERATARRSWRRRARTCFYRQPELLQEELSAVKPGRKGIVDVFLVGVAGYGQQDVFMREVDSVATLFRERFDADGPHRAAGQQPEDDAAHPVASATSLEAALQRVAECDGRRRGRAGPLPHLARLERPPVHAAALAAGAQADHAADAARDARRSGHQATAW